MKPIAFGPFVLFKTYPDAPPAAKSILNEASKDLSSPIVAVIKIDTQNGRSLVSSGADMLAVVNAAFDSKEVYSNIKSLNKLFQSRERTLIT